MNNYSIFKYYVDFKDGSDEKKRPIVVIKISDDNFETTALGIYSYKNKFTENKEFYLRFLYEIQDVEIAGLNLDKRSYIDISIAEKYSFQELLAGAEYIGQLSERDVIGLKDKINVFYSN